MFFVQCLFHENQSYLHINIHWNVIKYTDVPCICDLSTKFDDIKIFFIGSSVVQGGWEGDWTYAMHASTSVHGKSLRKYTSLNSTVKLKCILLIMCGGGDII